MKNLPNGLSHDIVDLMPYPLLILDSELRVQIANRSFNQTFHVPLEGIEDRFIFGVGNGEWNIAALRMQLQKAFFEDTQIEDLEIQSDLPVIGRRNIMVSTTRIHSQDNVVPFILLTFNDVTKSKKTEDSTGFEKQLLDAAGQAIIATDLDGAIIYWNRFAETLYGWSTPDVMGRNIVDVNSADTWRQQDNEAMDITERKQGQEALRKNEQRVRALV